MGVAEAMRIGALQAYQANDKLVIEWDRIDQEFDGPAGLVRPVRGSFPVEVRRGSNWATAHVICCRTLCCRIVTDDWVEGTYNVFVRPVGPDGWYADETEVVQVTMVDPPSHTIPTTSSRDEHALGWQGTKTGVEVDVDGHLVIVSGGTQGVYESPEFDLGEVALHRFGVWSSDDFVDTNRTWNSLETTWDEATGDWDTYKQAWRDFAPSWETVAVRETDWADNPYDPSRGYVIEVAVHEAEGATPVYHRHVAGAVYYGRYARVRVTLYREQLTGHTIKLTGLRSDWSIPGTVGSSPAGGGYEPLNIRSFGATRASTVGAAVDCTDALDDALAAAKAQGGGVVYVPNGYWGTVRAIKVPDGVRLVGDGARNSVLVALQASWGADTHMVRLGEGLGIVFFSRVENLGLIASHIGPIDCIYSNEAQEGCGVFHVQLDDYTSYGVNFEQSGTACSDVGCEYVNCFPSETAGSAGGFRLKQCANTSYLRECWATQTSASHTDGVLIDASDVTLEGFHCEGHTDGVHIQNGGGGRILDVHGHNSLTNVVHVGSGVLFVICENIRKSGAAVTILDDEESETVTADVVERYAKREADEFRVTVRDKLWRKGMTAGNLVQANAAGDSLETSGMKLNPVQISANKMLHVHSDGVEIRATRDLPLGAVVGTTDEQTLEKKTFKVQGAGSWATQAFKILSPGTAFTYDVVPGTLTASRAINLPVLTGADTLIFQLQAQELEAKTFVVAGTGAFVNTAFRVRSPGTSFDFAFDPPGSLGLSRSITWPLPTQATSTLPFLEQAQEFKGEQSFSGGLRIEDGDATPQWVTLDVAGALAANRTLSIPVLTGNDTMVTEAHTQTLTNKTVSGGTVTNVALSGTIGGSTATINTNLTYEGENQYNGPFVFNDDMVQGVTGPGRFKLQQKATSFSSETLELWVEKDGFDYSLKYDTGGDGVITFATVTV